MKKPAAARVHEPELPFPSRKPPRRFSPEEVIQGAIARRPPTPSASTTYAGHTGGRAMRIAVYMLSVGLLLVPARDPAAQDLFVYPTRNQSDEQITRDKEECHD